MFNPAALSAVIHSAEEFKSIMLDWISGSEQHCPATAEAIDAFVEWSHDESEKWLTFEQWESFCVENDMA